MAAPPAAAGPPLRVVSINVCTDQLAALVAPETLVAVSRLADDPRSAAMHAELAGYPRTGGHAEEVFLLAPDLVLAGTWSPHATAEMLERLGVPVVRFAPETGLSDVAANLRRMGEVLGAPARGEALAARFEADLAALRAPEGPRGALYHANGYTLGAGTLAGEILSAAGFANVAAELGYERGGVLPLEALVMAAPDALISGDPYPGASRSEEVPRHPALAAIAGGEVLRLGTGPDWVCGLPRVLGAIRGLRAARDALAEDVAP